ncbi:MAG TPA: hypothetical protein VK960_06305 [Acidimicrobiia bacterium]|nr:hypothetical protein [Acidimicrobiia bacterium]
MFDGTVLEFFGLQDASRRYHAGHILSVHLETDRKDRHVLTVEVNASTSVGGDRMPPLRVAPEQLAIAEDLVARLTREL